MIRYLILCLFILFSPVLGFAKPNTDIPKPIQKFNLSEVKLVLIGYVMNTHAQKPINGMDVQLQDINTKEVLNAYTDVNGQFYFFLQEDKVYQLHLIDENKKTVATKEISTIGKDKAEILYAMFNLENGRDNEETWRTEPLNINYAK